MNPSARGDENEIPDNGPQTERRSHPWQIFGLLFSLAAGCFHIYTLASRSHSAPSPSSEKLMADIKRIRTEQAALAHYPIYDMAGHSAAQVSSLLGPADSTIRDPRHHRPRRDADLVAFYLGHMVEVRYRHDSAVYFDFRQLYDYWWSDKEDVIGLSKQKPDTTGYNYEIYHNYEGLRRVEYIRSVESEIQTVEEIKIQVK